MGTLDLKLVLRLKDLEVSMYTDASHAVHPDLKSQVGIIIMVGGAPVFIKSAKLQAVKLSSTGSETGGLCQGSTYFLWVRGMLQELGYGSSQAGVVWQDNESAIRQTTQECAYRRSKHELLQRMAFVRELVGDGEIEVRYCPTNEMIADILTKPLQGEQFRYLRGRLMGHIDEHGEPYPD
jgi:hypothetical protein